MTNPKSSGRRFEQLVGDLYSLRGYSVEKNVLVRGKSGALHEVDLYGERRKGRILGKGCLERLAIECKYRGSFETVGKSEVASFVFKVKDADMGSGAVVTNSTFSSNACMVASFNDIKLIDGESLCRELASAGMYKENSNFIGPQDRKSAIGARECAYVAITAAYVARRISGRYWKLK
jgi:restriction endonuclease Mrr